MTDESNKRVFARHFGRPETFEIETIMPERIGAIELGRQLMLASKLGKTDLVRDLMRNGAPFATDWLGTSSLHIAAQGGHLDTCILLLKSGILADTKNKVDKTPLHCAAAGGFSAVVELLLQKGADVHSQDLLFMTPLHWAVEYKHVECIKVLLQYGAFPHMRNKFERTCVDIALHADRQDIVELLVNSEENESSIVVKPTKFIQPGQKSPVFKTVARLDSQILKNQHGKSRDHPVETVKLQSSNQDSQNPIRKVPLTQNKDAVKMFSSSNILKKNVQITLNKSPQISASVISNKNKPTSTSSTPKQFSRFSENNHVTLNYFNSEGDQSVTTNLKLTPSVKIKIDKIEIKEEIDRDATMQLLEEHGIEMLEGEDIDLVASAVGSGQTVVLTEAGKQALNLTQDQKPYNCLKRSSTTSSNHHNENQAKIIRISHQQLMDSISNKNKHEQTNEAKIIEIRGSESKFQEKQIIVSKNSSALNINEELAAARREALQYKLLYAKKQKEAEAYKSKLKYFELSLNSDHNDDDCEEIEEYYEDEEQNIQE